MSPPWCDAVCVILRGRENKKVCNFAHLFLLFL